MARCQRATQAAAQIDAASWGGTDGNGHGRAAWDPGAEKAEGVALHLCHFDVVEGDRKTKPNVIFY